MNIVVTKVHYPYISFTSNNGDGIAYAANQVFEPGSIHGVEFDFQSDLDMNKNTKVGTLKEAGFYYEGDGTLIVALVESIFEDDEICLRIAQDCIILAYSTDKAIQQGDMLEITLPNNDFIITSIGRGLPEFLK